MEEIRNEEENMNDFEQVSYYVNKDKDKGSGLKEKINPNLTEELSSSLIKLFASKKFLFIAILYSINFVLSVVVFITNLNIQNFINLIIPSIILFSVWKTYIDAKDPNKYDQTVGLKIIRGVLTISIVILLILAAVIFIFAFRAATLFLLVFVIGAIIIGYNLFRKLITDTIESIEYGNTNTKHHLAGAFFLVASSIILLFLLLIITSGMIESKLGDAIVREGINFDIMAISFIVQVIFSFHLMYLILRAQQIVEFIVIKKLK